MLLIWKHSHIFIYYFFFFPRPVNTLGSPRKRKTLSHALQHLHSALSVGSLLWNQNSDNLLNSIVMQNPQTQIKEPPIWLYDCQTRVLFYEVVLSV